MQRPTFTEATERYRQTLVFNNDLLKKNFPERYDFTTVMQANKRRTLGVPEERVTVYASKRTADYSKKLELYSKKLDAIVEPAVQRYVNNLRAAILGTTE